MNQQLNCVLLVDDNEDDNFFHEIVLRKAGLTATIKTAETAIDALALLEETSFTPGLIFLDINMPKMNGWEFLEHYKNLKTEKKSAIIIIMLTTSSNPADKKRAENIPEISGFEHKPLTHEAIKKIIQKYFPHAL